MEFISPSASRLVEGSAAERCRLDLRYATDAEEDAPDIAALVNEYYSVEEEEYSGAPEVSDPIVFRTAGSKISVAEVERDIQRPGAARWIVLETAAPEEAAVAATRIRISPEESKATIDIFAVRSADDRVQFLVRIESLVRSLGVTRLVVQCPHWRGDVQEWLEASGYSDRGGFAWPEELKHQVLRHTMILEYERDIRIPRSDGPSRDAEAIFGGSSATGSDAIATEGDDILDELGGLDIRIEDVSGPSTLESTIVDLFAALHREASTLS